MTTLPSQLGTKPSNVGGDDVAVVDCPDEQLVVGVVHGHHYALAELHRRHSRSVFATAHRNLKNVADCEDVVSEVFTSLWQNPENFDCERGCLLAYLRMKARGRSIDVVRSQEGRRRREEGSGDRSTCFASGSDEVYLAAENVEKLRIAVASLNDIEREAITLAFFADMTYVDVAEHLNLPEGTVKSRIRKGLRNLRVSYENGIRPETAPKGVPVRPPRVANNSHQIVPEEVLAALELPEDPTAEQESMGVRGRAA